MPIFPFKKRKSKENKSQKPFPDFPYNSLVETLQELSAKQPHKRLYT